MSKKTTLTLTVEYDPKRTDAESVATALDRLLETVMSTPGILDEYGPIQVGEFRQLHTGADVVAYTIDAAPDPLLPFVEEAFENAGYLWKCPACRYTHNLCDPDMEVDSCAECGQSRFE